MSRILPLLLAIGAFVASTVAWVVTDQRASERVYDEYSSENTSDTGLSQAAAYLERRGKVARLTRALSRTPVEADAVIFRVTKDVPLLFDPEDLLETQVGPPRPRQRTLLSAEEDAFVRRGGRMIVAAHEGLLPAAGTDATTASKVFPLWPGIDRLQGSPKGNAFLTLRPRMHALFTAANRVVLARERIGSGELLVLSWPDLLQNAHLGEADHLALIAALSGKRPVYFDEVPHGIVSGDGVLELMKDWNLGAFLMMLCAIALLVFWRGNTRVGAAEHEDRETRSEAIDLVASLGALYRAVTPYDQAIALYRDALTRTVAHTSGLRGDALRKRVDELTHGRLTLQALNEGFAAFRSSRRPESAIGGGSVATGSNEAGSIAGERA